MSSTSFFIIIIQRNIRLAESAWAGIGFEGLRKHRISSGKAPVRRSLLQ